MTRGVVVDLADDLEAVAVVEVRCLKAVGAERQPTAAAEARIVGRGLEKARSESVPAGVLADPEVLDPARAAPGPSVDAADQCIARVAHLGERFAAVVDAGGGEVESS